MVGSISLGVVFLFLVDVALSLGSGESEGEVKLESFAVVLCLGLLCRTIR